MPSSPAGGASSRLSPFVQQVKLALEHVHDAAWLQHHSPLAEPYFLASLADVGDGLAAADGGEQLAQQLWAAAARLWGDPLPASAEQLAGALRDDPQRDRYAFWLLCLSYFDRFLPDGARPPLAQAAIYHDVLHISRASYDRHLHAAIQRLSERLLERVQPILRAAPPVPGRALVGRVHERAQAQAAWEQRRTVVLSGAHGVGKTTLGLALCANWPADRCFWYTVRPALHDGLPSVLFALAYFLFRQGQTALWLQIVADGGEIRNLELALGLARSALAALPAPVLLCFDDVDAALPGAGDQLSADRLAVLAFIDSLRHVSAILVLGQQLVCEADLHLPLAGLTQAELEQLVRREHVPASPADVQQLAEYTGGNPLLVELCLALCDQTAALGQVLAQLPATTTLAPMVLRVLRHVTPEQRQLLERLAVYRSPAPRSALTWGDPAGDAVMDSLIERRLVTRERHSAVGLPRALRDALVAQLGAATRRRYERDATLTRAQRGDYTAAAFHLLQAGEPGAAVDLWYPQRESEVSRGQGPAALRVFAEVDSAALTPEEQQRLALLRARLYRLTGRADAALAVLDDAPWQHDDLSGVDAAAERGYFLQRLGQTDAALAAYDEGLDTLALLQRRARVLASRARLLHRERDFERAQRDVQRVKFETERLQGILHEERGSYSTARTHFWSALTIAEALNEAAAVADCYCHLAIIETRHAKLEIARDFFDRAAALYSQIGDQYLLESTRANLAGALLQVGAYADMVEPATAALHYFRAAGDTLWIAALCSNLAEASLQLGDLDAARRYAGESLAQNEQQFVPYALFTLAEMARATADSPQAEQLYRDAMTRSDANEDRFMLAYAVRGLGQTLQARGAQTQAAALLEQARDLFDQLGLEQERARTADLLAAPGS